MPERQDDPVIEDDTRLWRRVHPDWLKEDDAGWRAGSITFRDYRSGEVSFDIAAETNRETMLSGFPEWSLVEVTVGVVRSAGYVVARDPEGGGPSHVVACPKPEIAARRKAMERASKQIANQSQLIVTRPPTSDR